jgi:hypothetical protein
MNRKRFVVAASLSKEWIMRKAHVLAVLLSVLVGGLTGVNAQESRGGSLTAQDYVDIQQLYARYNYAIDSSDIEAYVALYTSDGAFNNFTGQDGLRTFMKNRNAGTRRHWNTNLVITPTPEGAKGAVYLMFLDVGMKPPAVTSAGKYEDVLVKTPQGWRFKKRQTFPDPPAAPPSALPTQQTPK